MERLDKNEYSKSNYNEEDEERKDSHDPSCRDTFSVNDSFHTQGIITKQKNLTSTEDEIKWKYANFLGGTQEDNID